MIIVKYIYLTDIEPYYTKIAEIRYPNIVLKCNKISNKRTATFAKIFSTLYDSSDRIVLDITDYTLKELSEDFDNVDINITEEISGTKKENINAIQILLYDSTIRHLPYKEVPKLESQIQNFELLKNFPLIKHLSYYTDNDKFIFTHVKNNHSLPGKKEFFLTELCSIQQLANIKYSPYTSFFTNLFYKASVSEKVIYYNPYIKMLQWVNTSFIQPLGSKIKLTPSEKIYSSIVAIKDFQDNL